DVLLDAVTPLDDRLRSNEPRLEVDRRRVLCRDEDRVLARHRDPGSEAGQVGALAGALRTCEELKRRALPERTLEPLDRPHLDERDRCRNESCWIAGPSLAPKRKEVFNGTGKVAPVTIGRAQPHRPAADDLRCLRCPDVAVLVGVVTEIDGRSARDD